MSRWLETGITALVLGGGAVVHFGLLDDAAALVRPAPADSPAGSNDPWSENYVPPAPAVYYRNCDAARAAGAAPVRLGEPGYADHLDRDGDGIGCEPYYGRR